MGGGQQIGLNGEIVGEEINGKIVVGRDAANASRRHYGHIWTKPIQQAIDFFLAPQICLAARGGENLATLARQSPHERRPRHPGVTGHENFPVPQRKRVLVAPHAKTSITLVAPRGLAFQAPEV
jgi:hypothetical protein